MTWRRVPLAGADATRRALGALDAMSAPAAPLRHAASAIAALCAAVPPELVGPPDADAALACVLDAIDERAGLAGAEARRAVRRPDPGDARGGAWRRPPVAAGPVAEPERFRPARSPALPSPDLDRSSAVGEITRAWRRAGLEPPTGEGGPLAARAARSAPASRPGAIDPVAGTAPPVWLPRPASGGAEGPASPDTHRSAAAGEITQAWPRTGLPSPAGEGQLLAARGARTPLPSLTDGLAAFTARSPGLDRARRQRLAPASRSPGLDHARPGATPAPRPIADPITESEPPALLPRPAPESSRSHTDARIATASPAAAPPRGLGGLVSWWSERGHQASAAPSGPVRSEPPAPPARSPHVRAADARGPWPPAPRGDLDPPPSRLAVGQGLSAALSAAPSPARGDGHAATAALAGIDDVTRALERVLVRELRRHGITPEDP